MTAPTGEPGGESVPLGHAFQGADSSERCAYYIGGNPNTSWAYCNRSRAEHESSATSAGGESVVSAEAQAVVDEWAAGPSTTFARLVSLISSALEAAREEGRQEARFDHLHGLARGTNVLLEMVKAKAREEERERCAKQLCSGCNASAPQERPGWNGLWHFVERDLWSTCAAASFLARPTPKAPEGGPTKCADCGFSPGAHADGYCPNCVGGTRYVPRVAAPEGGETGRPK